jgi:hypothetical protein
MGYEKRKKKKASPSSSCCGPSPVDTQRWEAEDDLRAFARVAAVKKDPERMARMKAMAKEKLDESKGKKAEAEVLIRMGQGGK